jgi:hypothetical protein
MAARHDAPAATGVGRPRTQAAAGAVWVLRRGVERPRVTPRLNERQLHALRSRITEARFHRGHTSVVVGVALDPFTTS